jgi:tRNA pseudouridine55 synthase
MQKPARVAVHGVLLLDKPVGFTSNAALQKAKWLLNALKAGHTGTLDPFADGLLPLCFGEATKFSAYLLDADKHYRAVMRLGVTTATGDPEGEVLSTQRVDVDCAQIAAALAPFRGDIEQIPPMYSALKHLGRPLYEYARAGIDIARPPRKVTIRALTLGNCAPPVATLDVHCSAGTYIRTLAQDLGAALGCGAHLTALTRLASGGFALADAISLADLEALSPDERRARLLPMDCLLAHLPRLTLADDVCRALRQGRRPAVADTPVACARVYDAAGAFVGLVRVDDGVMSVVRLADTTAFHTPAFHTPAFHTPSTA